MRRQNRYRRRVTFRHLTVLVIAIAGACSFNTSGSSDIDGGVAPPDGDIVTADGGAVGEGCVGDEDCVEGVCDEDAQVCVECLGDGDCDGVCDVEANRCVECIGDDVCGDGRVCTEDNQCIDDPRRLAICGDEEVDLNSDAGHCGACDNACGAGTSGDCVDGHCESQVACDEGETEDFGAGDGSEDDPYLICNAAQLERLSGSDDGDLLSSHFLVTAPLPLDGLQWAPFGGSDEFEGRFDGNHHPISSFAIDLGSSRSGFFEHIDDDGEVRNVILENVDGLGEDNEVGLLAGRNDGLIENAIVRGTVAGAERVGGMVGRNDGSIRASRAEITVSATESVVGGLVGICDGGEIATSIATGSVKGEREVGGLVGLAESDCLISDARTDAEVTAQNSRVGGLAGRLRSDAAVQRSSAKGRVEIDGDGDEAGGLVGRMHSSGTSVVESFATGAVIAPASDDVGGLVGRVRRPALIRNSYATGDVQGKDEVGGLLGRIEQSDTTVENTYSVGLVEGDDIGGLVGKSDDDDDVLASYWWFDADENADQPDESAGGESRTTGEFAERSSFQGWDFSQVWSIEDGQGDPVPRRPILRWQLTP